MSVRIMAAGAVVVLSVACFTAPARACDDRYVEKCEKASAEAFAAGEGASDASARRSSRRVKIVAARRSRHANIVRRRGAPRFASRRAEPVEIAEAVEPRRTLPDTPMARRFRGFISQLPIAQNTFEALRKPHAVAIDFDAATILPPVVAADAEPAQAEPVAQSAPTAPPAVVTTAKQDKLVPKPAPMELASAESKPVVLPALPPVKAAVPALPPVKAAVPLPARPVVMQTAAADASIVPVQPVLSEASPDGPKPSSFSIHGLVLALCGALGAASALRFIVGA